MGHPSFSSDVLGISFNLCVCFLTLLRLMAAVEEHLFYKPELGIRNVCKKLVISLYFCNFMVENQTITINITMITKNKITEIFCIADDFCKEFELETDKM